MIGQTISHYNILEKLGEGGMGIVYKAEDTKLDRTVALKFLPAQLAATAQDKARFVQEAKAAAALNHPNVCSIIDIQEHDGQMFMVMEFVDGQTLREKIGTLLLKQAIDVGIQIADGLAAAHEKGIVHRDIKPENIMIRKDGIPQIMDFGLAKLRSASSKINRLTKEGSTVGTAGYMSPEQVQGQDVDHRSDIFSYGVVLYEIFTGQLPFKGVHETALAYEIVNVDAAPMSSFKQDIDPALDAIILDCLEKDVKERCQSVAEVARDLRKIRRESTRQRASRVTASRPAYVPSSSPGETLLASSGINPGAVLRKKFHIGWMATIVFLLSTALFAFLYFNRPAQKVQVIRSFILSPEKTTFANQAGGQGGGHFAISPDGNSLVFAAVDSSGKSRLWVRNFSSLSAQPLPGTEGGFYPFWSPDNHFIGFFASGKLKKIEAAGGPPLTICDAQSGRGGSWNQDGEIVFSPNAFDIIYRVPAGGGTPVAITKLDTARRERTHRWPRFLPDGNHIFYFARITGTGGGFNEGDALYVASLDGTMNKRIGPVSGNVEYANGYLLFLREKTLMAQPFDVNELGFTGDAVPVAEQVQFDPGFSKGKFSVSNDGNLVYQMGSAISGSQLVWVDRTGKQISVLGGTAEYASARLSQDEKKVVVELFDPQLRNQDIWIYEVARDIRTRFTFDAAADRSPIWSPDGNRVVFRSDRKGRFDLYQKPSSGAGTEQLLVASDLDKTPSDWSADGRYITYFSIGDPKTKVDLWVLPLFPEGTNGDQKPIPFLQTEFNETGGRFSPDMKWIVYVSDESGKSEVYVRPFPGPGGKWQVSMNGGAFPRWRRDGKELYYLSDDGEVMVAEVKGIGSTFEVGAVRPLFDLQSKGQSTFQDVSADGQRFLVNLFPTEQSSSPITLVTNWVSELKKK